MDRSVQSRINIKQGDITRQNLDAVVNAANNRLSGGGGVDGAIHRAAGPQLLAECRTIGGCPTGEARITKGYNLPAKQVIHTVGPVYSGMPRDAQLLASCYRSSLELAVDNGVQTIAFPAISCGVYGYPIEQAAKVALETVITFLEKEPSIQAVIFMLFSDDHVRVYEETLSRQS